MVITCLGLKTNSMKQ